MVYHDFRKFASKSNSHHRHDLSISGPCLSCRYSCVALHRTVGCARNRQTNIIIPSTDSINNRRSKHATPFPENNRVLKYLPLEKVIEKYYDYRRQYLKVLL